MGNRLGKMSSKPGLRKRGAKVHPAGAEELEEPLLGEDFVHVSAAEALEGGATSATEAGPASTQQAMASEQEQPLLGDQVVARPALPQQLATLWRNVVAACLHSWRYVRDALMWCLSTLGLLPAPPPRLSLVQRERLELLQERIGVPYDADAPAHQAALRALWEAAFPGEVFPPGVKSERWKDMGWQSDDPGRDFRGAGLVSLECLLFMAQREQATFSDLMRKVEGTRAEWEYPFAAAGVNLTYTLTEVLDLRQAGSVPSSPAGRAFLRLMAESDTAFEELFVAAYQLLDRAWLDMGASYMQFPTVLKAVRLRLEQELCRGGAQSLDDLRRRLML